MSLTIVLLTLLCSIFLQPPTTAAAASLHCTTLTRTKKYNKCMTLPTQEASIAWTHHLQNSTLELAFFGTFISPSGWVAWGINPTSPEMNGARVLAAFVDPTNGGLVVLPYVLDPTVKFQRSPLTSRPLDVHLLSSSVATGSGTRGSVVEIHVRLKIVPNRTTIHHVWNRGLYVQGYSPTIHRTSPEDLASRGTFDVLSSSATGAPPSAPSWLRPTHAVLNTISWGFCLPIGVIVARYLRHYNSLSPTWFYIHITFQVTGFLLGTAGFAAGIILGRGSVGISYPVHRNLGVAAVFMGSLQSLALLFRPKTTNKYRKYWKSYHHLVGYGCVVVGVVNVFQGFDVMGIGGSSAELAYCLALSTVIGICASLEVNSWVLFCRKAKEEKLRREGIGETSGTVKSNCDGL